MIWVIVGTFVVSLAITYAWWVEVRVIRLRQDIFDKRVALFDAAMMFEGFDDKAYRAARNHFNAIALSASAISIPVITYWVNLGQKQDKPVPKHGDPRMQKEIEQTLEWCTDRIARYVLFETFDGWTTIFWAWTCSIRTSFEKQIAESVRGWINSRIPEAMVATIVASTQSMST